MANPEEKNNKGIKKKLKASQERLKFLVSSSPAIIYTSKTSGDYGATYISENVKELTGYDPEDFTKYSNFWVDHIHQDDKERVLSGLQTLYKKGRHQQEYRFQFKDGTYHWMLDDLNLIRDKKGDPIETIGYWIDITKRKETEDKLRNSEKNLKKLTKELEERIEERTKKLQESEEKFKTISEESMIGIIIIQDDIVKYVNQQAADWIGYTIEEMKTWEPGDIFNIIYEEDRNRVKKFTKQIQKGLDKSVLHYYFRAINKNGDIIWLDNYDKTISLDGKSANLSFFINITEKIKIENKIKDSEEKYRIAYNQANFYKDLFAHDMYNILQNILSSSELCKFYLKYDKNQGRIDELLEIIRDQVKKGSNLIFKVQKLSEINDAQMPIESKDACKILKDSIDFVRDSYQKKELNIQIDSFSKKVFIQANDLLFDVFENILVNGIRHNINSKIEFFIKISEEQRKGVNYIKFEFQDNGIGIKNDHKEIIFQRDTKRDKNARGMGLGLSLVKKIIDSYSGKICVKDRIKGDYTKGSNFIVLIPRAT